MRICFLTKYATAGASSRDRCYLFADVLRRNGHGVDFSYLLGDDYVYRIHSGRRASPIGLAFALIRRLGAVINAGKYDVVVLQYEAFPRMPMLWERLLFFFNSNVILDIDDAWYEVYADKPHLRSKFPWLMGRSRAVVAGSRILAEFATQFNDRVITVPTVVDITKYLPKQPEEKVASLEIVWIGTPLNSKLLLPNQRVWQYLSGAYPNLVFKFIGVWNNFHLEGVRYRVIEWSEATEAQEIRSADIGIMPLQDQPFHRGKCAKKIIQYMAAGLPVVASAVGANVDVIREGETGFLVTSDVEWVRALSALIEDASLRQRMGERGRSRAEKLYSIGAVFPVLEAVFAEVARSRSKHLNTINGHENTHGRVPR
jgi:glycosyltransferase involved in cell wall biosynthesis